MVGAAGPEAFFLPAEPGARFALFHLVPEVAVRGAVLYVHPFAEEMNKSRRMAALQARAFAAAGFPVLQIDLYGCGDSSGDFGDARWDIWKRDLSLAAAWLEKRLNTSLHLWGLRLGAALALDCWRDEPNRFASALLWQPVANGETFVTQFLRLAVAGDALREGAPGLTTESLRRRLDAGESVEVAGYELAPDLIHSIDRMRLVDSAMPGAALHWVEVRSGNSAGLSPAAQRVLDAWREKDMTVTSEVVAGDPFWATQEIAEVAGLIQASMNRYGMLAE